MITIGLESVPFHPGNKEYIARYKQDLDTVILGKRITLHVTMEGSSPAFKELDLKGYSQALSDLDTTLKSILAQAEIEFEGNGITLSWRRIVDGLTDVYIRLTADPTFTKATFYVISIRTRACEDLISAEFSNGKQVGSVSVTG
jgi:hypothetical protein